ncbi:hypothetical protein [Caballeronia sp. AZ7_KS35]|uniref:hypothetical protein n=1 Tax=Caballeronia sp. AZ7_KS35 TaxID=2921762 RepID=UPI00202833EF|nr:hypothetical protein [Caballeronia sp. AZ7_KS35]
MENLAERLRLVIAEHTSPSRRFAELQALSGDRISADSWKNCWHGRQRPTGEMIELVAQSWPEHAFWLVTGAPYPGAGHEEPGRPGWDWLVGLNVGEHVYAKRVLRHRVHMKMSVDTQLQAGNAEVVTKEDAVRVLMRDEPSQWTEAGTLEEMANSERQLLAERYIHGNKKKRK